MEKQDLYEILGVKKDATLKEIKNAYRKKAVENHPDKEGGSAEKMAAINHAKDILTDPGRRKKYDETGFDGKEPTFDQRFRQTLDDLLMQIVKQPANDPDKIDVVGLINSSIQDALDNYKSKKATMITQLHKMLSIKKRTKSKDKTIQYILDVRIGQCNQALAKMSDEIKYCEECIEFMKKYEYEFEPPKSPGFTTIIINA